MTAKFDPEIKALKIRLSFDEVEGKIVNRTYTINNINPEKDAATLQSFAETIAACQTGTLAEVLTAVTDVVANQDVRETTIYRR